MTRVRLNIAAEKSWPHGGHGTGMQINEWVEEVVAIVGNNAIMVGRRGAER